MYVFRNGTISSSENIITAHRVSPRAPVGYKFARLHYPDIHIPNRGAAWDLFFLPEDSEKKQQLRGDVDSYNAYLDYLDSLDGFKSFFILEENYGCFRGTDRGKQIIANWRASNWSLSI